MPGIGILGTAENWHTQALRQAFARLGYDVVWLPVTRLAARVGGRPAATAGGHGADDLEAVLVRGIPGGSLEQVIFRLDVMHTLDRMGVLVVNPPAAVEKTVDKFYTSRLLAEAGLPTPETIVAERMEEAMAAFHHFRDVVVKPLFGSLGKGMVRITDADTAYRVFRALELSRSIFYLQRFIPHDNRDVRALVVGERVVAAMHRVAEGWKTNLAQGGRAEPCRLDDALAACCVRAARAVGAYYAGVDLVTDSRGSHYVVEVNGIPGWSGLQSTTSLDIAGEIAGLVDGLLRGRKRPGEVRK